MLKIRKKRTFNLKKGECSICLKEIIFIYNKYPILCPECKLGLRIENHIKNQ